MTRKLIIIILFLLLSLGLTLTYIFRTTIFSGRAFTSTSNFNGSLANSYLFASPLMAPADGRQLIRVTVYILDDRGLGVSNQTVSVTSTPTLSIIPIQPVTDEYGKAIYDISATSPGQYQLSASVSGSSLPQSVKVSFQ